MISIAAGIVFTPMLLSPLLALLFTAVLAEESYFGESALLFTSFPLALFAIGLAET